MMSSTKTPVNVINDCCVQKTSETSLALLDFRLHKDNEGLWIQCDRCDAWRHVVSAKDPLEFIDTIFYCADVKKHCGSPSDPGVDGLFYHPEFFPGNVVWAQKEKDSIGHGSVWWPALIEDAHDRCSQFFLLDANRGSESRPIAYHVTFLDTFRTGGWVSANKIVVFVDDPADILRYQQQKSVATVAKRARLMTEAIERARNALRATDILNRLELFSFVAYVARHRGVLKASEKADNIANNKSNVIAAESSVPASQQPESPSSSEKAFRLKAKKRPYAATLKDTEKPKLKKKATVAKDPTQKVASDSPRSTGPQKQRFMLHSQGGSKKRFINLIREKGKSRAQLSSLLIQSDSIEKTGSKLQLPIKSQSGPTNNDIQSETSKQMVEISLEKVVPVETSNETESLPDVGAIEEPSESMTVQSDISEQRKNQETSEVQKQSKQSTISEANRATKRAEETVPIEDKTTIQQEQQGIIKNVVKRPAHSAPRNRKLHFVPPTKHTSGEVDKTLSVSTTKFVQNEQKQAVLSENRVAKTATQVKTQLPVRLSVPLQQPQQVLQNSQQNRRRSPSPYTVDWLEATYESKCANLITDSDCDSGIVDSLARNEDYSPEIHSKPEGPHFVGHQSQRDSGEVNMLHLNPKVSLARTNARPVQKIFSLPPRKPFKPSSQEGFPSQDSQSTSLSQPTSQGSWTSQDSRVYRQSSSQSQEW